MEYMLQNDTLFPWLNILDNCLLGVKIKKEVTKENIDRVKTLLETYGLSDFAYKYPRNLSGGMRQRVALIRTLAINPDILLLDEPFSALDYQTRLAVSDDVWKIIKKEKKTTIMITHDVAEAISMADRVVVLSNRPAKVKSIYNIEMMNKSTPIGNRNKEEFKDYTIKFVVLLVDEKNLLLRDKERPEDCQMKERCITLLNNFKNNNYNKQNILDTSNCTIYETVDIIENDNRFIL